MADNNDMVNPPSEPQEEPEIPLIEEDLSENELDDVAGGFKFAQNISEIYKFKPGFKGNNFQTRKGENWGIAIEN